MRHQLNCVLTCGLSIMTFWAMPVCHAAEPPVDYEQSIAPLFRKYCAGCHNDADHQGDFSLESYSSLQGGIKSRPALLPGDSAGSRLWRVLNEGGNPQMPPEGEKAPSAEELAVLKVWIDQGAKGPAGTEPDRYTMHVPRIERHTTTNPVTALATSPDGKALAIGQFGRVEIRRADSPGQPASAWGIDRVLEGFAGKIKSIHFCADGRQLITASGVAGSAGIATLWNVETGERIREFKGHRDIIFDAEVSPDGRTLATCSYDRDIILWDLTSGQTLRTLSGHNGAVYDIAFHPHGTVLASSSADDTCKIWRVRDGERLDTLAQPLKEQYVIDFSKDGKTVISSGADHQIRVWKLLSEERPAINPMSVVRYAHEAPIISMALTADGKQLITSAEDQTIKVWDTRDFREQLLIEQQSDVVSAVTVVPGAAEMVVGRLDGTWEVLPLPAPNTVNQAEMAPAEIAVHAAESLPAKEFTETEPNQTPAQAQMVELPAKIHGTINIAGKQPDHDEFRFKAVAGVEWVIEVNAARSKSPLDSFVEVLTSDGKPIERKLLQAVRESYFTFRSKDGKQSGDFRLFQWDEMSLNDLLYSNGEVVKLWRAPRGPDSGFDVYPGAGERWGYLDTSGLAHALNETCYIVHAYDPGTELIPNGLPQFPVYYANDDAARREAGKDSKLFFTAPEDGEYILKIRDVRGMQGPDFKYTVDIRPPARDFVVSHNKEKLAISPGNHAELRFAVDRKDQFDGPVIIELNGLPPGFSFNNPLVIEEEQIDATAVISVAAETPSPTPEQIKQIEISASAVINGKEVTHIVGGFSEVTVRKVPSFTVAIEPASGGATPIKASEGAPLEFEIHPGETIMLKVTAQRNGHKEIIDFGGAESGRNLPHGVYVDNIGLNGLMMLPEQSEQTFFITAIPGVQEQTRLFHLQARQGGEISTPEVVLHVRNSNARVSSQP